MAELQSNFIHNLKEARRRRGLTQAELAEKTDLSVGFIGDIETGRANPSLNTIGIIAEVLGIEPFELLIPQQKGKKIEEAQLSIVIDEVREVLKRYMVPE